MRTCRRTHPRLHARICVDSVAPTSRGARKSGGEPAYWRIYNNEKNKEETARITAYIHAVNNEKEGGGGSHFLVRFFMATPVASCLFVYACRVRFVASCVLLPPMPDAAHNSTRRNMKIRQPFQVKELGVLNGPQQKMLPFFFCFNNCVGVQTNGGIYKKNNACIQNKNLFLQDKRKVVGCVVSSHPQWSKTYVSSHPPWSKLNFRFWFTPFLHTLPPFPQFNVE